MAGDARAGLEEELTRALQRGAGAVPVDVGGLLEGARARVGVLRRRRQRRAAGVVLAAVLLAGASGRSRRHGRRPKDTEALTTARLT